MSEELKIESPETEIAALKSRISELEKSTPGVSGKEAVEKAISEHLNKPAGVVLAPSYQFPPAQVQAHAVAVTTTASMAKAEEVCQSHVNELLKLAQVKGIFNSVLVARHVGNSHILDHFHDALVNWFQQAHNIK